MIKDVLVPEEMIVYDLETSGTDPYEHEIIQIAAKHLKSGDTFEAKLGFDISKADPKALEVNCFDPDVWDEEGIHPKKAVKRLSKFMKEHPGLKRYAKRTGNPWYTSVLGGYNVAAFDNIFLQRLFKKYEVFSNFDVRVYDAFQPMLFLMPGMDNYQLGTICEGLGITLGNAHDAIADVDATAMVIAWVINETIPDGEEPSWLEEYLNG